MIVFFLFGVFIYGCSSTGQGNLKTPSIHTFSLSGITFHSPNEDGWVIAQSSQSEVVFEREGDQVKSTARTRVYPIDVSEKDEIFLRLQEQKQKKN